MSKRNPDNGPTFSNAPPKRVKPMTEKQLADWYDRKDAEQEQIIRDAAKERKFHEILHREGWIAAREYLRSLRSG